MSEWPEYHLDKVYSFASGLSKSRKEFGFGYPFLTFKEVFNNFFVPKMLESLANTTDRERDRCSINKGDVFLTRTSETQDELGMSCVALCNYPNATFNGFTKRLRPKGKINILPLYAGYYFRSPKFRATVSTMASITTRASLNNSMLSALTIVVPPPEIQEVISAVLSSLDDKIDLLHRQNKTLEALAQTLFRHWFIDGADDDWEDGTLNDVLTAVGGTTPSTKNPDFWNGDIHWTTPRDLSNNDSLYLLDTARKITESGLAKISSGLLPGGTLLLSSRAPVGYLGFSEVPIAINQGYIAILDDKGLSKHFIYLWLKENMDYVKSYAGGTTFMEISKSSFRTLEIEIPPADLRAEFEELISPLFEKIRVNTHQIRTLENLRDTLLPKLMSGEVHVRL